MSSKKFDNITQNIKESNTIDKKHKEIIKKFNDDKNNINNIDNKLIELKEKLEESNKIRVRFTLDDLNNRAELLKNIDSLENEKNDIMTNFNEMDYYDKTGDLIIQYYELRDCKETVKETRNILDFFDKKKIEYKSKNEINKAELFNKYWQRIEGVRINLDDGTKRIKYCNECNLEKILDYSISAYVCPSTML
jgi:hypothetical protein